MTIVDPFAAKPVGAIVDPFDSKVATKQSETGLLGNIKNWWMSQPSAAQQFETQTRKDIEAFKRGGTKELMKDTGTTQALASGFIGSEISGRMPAVKTAKAAKPAIPAQEELATAAVAQGYKGGVMEVPLKEHVLPDIQKNILDELHSEHFRDYGAPFVFRAVKELETVEGKIPTVADIETVRQVLNRAPLDQRAAAAVARDKINQYLSEIQPHDTTIGENVGKVLGEIRGNYAALKRSELLTNAMERGHRAAESSGMGANLDNALRQQIKRILNNPKLLRGFSEAEIKQMEQIVKGGKIANLARMFSRFGPQHPLTGWGMAGIEGLKHGAIGPFLTLGGGHIAQKIAEGSTKRGITALEESVRKRSPLYQERAGPAPIPTPLMESPVMSTLLRTGGAAVPGAVDYTGEYLKQRGMQ